jgi:hypothetical protein
MKFNQWLPSCILMMGLVQACQSNAVLQSSAEMQNTPCPRTSMDLDTLFQQGVLPGRESNLVKQRMYWLEGSLDGQRVDTSVEWSLAVDTIFIPLRVRSLPDGRLRWSGSQSFYADVRPGVQTMEETVLEAHLWDMQNEALLVARAETFCWTALPSEWIVLETLSAP